MICCESDLWRGREHAFRVKQRGTYTTQFFRVVLATMLWRYLRVSCGLHVSQSRSANRSRVICTFCVARLVRITIKLAQDPEATSRPGQEEETPYR